MVMYMILSAEKNWWELVPNWATLVIALGAIIATGWLWRRQHLLEMKKEYDDLAESRKIFWNNLDRAYKRFRTGGSDSKPNRPERPADLVKKEGYPPGFKPRRGKNLLQWVNENENRLKRYKLWKFATCIYPGLQSEGEQSLACNFIALCYGEGSFDEARRKLAQFWNKWASMRRYRRYLYKYQDSAQEQLVMLTWLELALARRFREYGAGKVALFDIARKIDRKVRRRR